MAESFSHAIRRRASFRQDAAAGPDSSSDSGSSSSEEDDSGFVQILGSDADKKAAEGGTDADKGFKGAKSKAMAAMKAQK